MSKRRNLEPDRAEFRQKSKDQGECAEDLKYEAVVVCSIVRDTDPSNNKQICEPDGAHVDVVRFLVESFEAADLKVQILEGMGHKVFIKVKSLASFPIEISISFPF